MRSGLLVVTTMTSQSQRTAASVSHEMLQCGCTRSHGKRSLVRPPRRAAGFRGRRPASRPDDARIVAAAAEKHQRGAGAGEEHRQNLADIAAGAHNRHPCFCQVNARVLRGARHALERECRGVGVAGGHGHLMVVQREPAPRGHGGIGPEADHRDRNVVVAELLGNRSPHPESCPALPAAAGGGPRRRAPQAGTGTITRFISSANPCDVTTSRRTWAGSRKRRNLLPPSLQLLGRTRDVRPARGRSTPARLPPRSDE